MNRQTNRKGLPAMKLSDLPTAELRRAIAATIRTAGADAAETRALQRELARRESNERRAKKKVSRPGRPKSATGPLPSRSMKVSDAEWKAWKRAAKASGKPLNRWIRDICNMAAAAERAFR